MRILIILALLLTTLRIEAQRDSTIWGMRAHFTLNRCAYHMTTTDSTAVLGDELQRLEVSNYLPSMGLSLVRQFNTKIRIHAGLQYNAVGHRIDSLESAEIYDIRYRYDLIEIPLGLHYTLRPNKKFSPTLGVQVQIGRILQYRWSYRTFDSNTIETNKLESTAQGINWSSTLHAGVRIELHSKYSLEAQVQYQHYFQPIEKTTIERQYRQLGVNMSLVRYF